MNSEIKFAIDELDILMAKVARVHGDHHPELVEIKECYDALRDALINENTTLAKEKLKLAADLSSNFTLPEDACSAYTRVYDAFKILQNELA